MRKAAQKDMKVYTTMIMKGEFLTSSILEPEWVQLGFMYYPMFEMLFSCYVDFPLPKQAIHFLSREEDAFGVPLKKRTAK